jgi:hypothetical protein
MNQNVPREGQTQHPLQDTNEYINWFVPLVVVLSLAVAACMFEIFISQSPPHF